MTGHFIERRQPFWRYLLRNSWVVVSISLLMLYCEHRGLTHQWEMYGLDFLLQAKSKQESTCLRIVEITDDDYEEYFHSQSPLETDKLLQLIVAVAREEPTVIGVDLDIVQPGFRQSAVDQIAALKLAHPPEVIWAQTTLPPPLDRKPEHVLAPSDGYLNPDSQQLGVPLFPSDQDGKVRRYSRNVEVKDQRGGKAIARATFPWAIYLAAKRRRACREGREHEADSEELIFNFGGDRYSFNRVNAGQFLTASAQSASSRNPLTYRPVVLIGGRFAAARDQYLTPLGVTAGVDLIAFAVESELQGGGITEMKWWLSFLGDLFIGSLVVYFGYRYPIRKALALTFLAAVALPMLFSFVIFRSLNAWFSFVPVALGVALHELYDHAVESPETEEKLETTREKLDSALEANQRLMEELSSLQREREPEHPHEKHPAPPPPEG